MIKPEHLFNLTCSDCPKHKWCKTPCVFVDKLAGKDKSCRECLPPPDNHLACSECPESKQGCMGQCEETDYNKKLIAVKDARDSLKPKTIADVRGLADLRLRAVAAMLYADISTAEIALILDISRRRVYQIINDTR